MEPVDNFDSNYQDTRGNVDPTTVNDRGSNEHIDRIRTHLLELRNWQLQIHTSVAHLMCQVVHTIYETDLLNHSRRVPRSVADTSEDYRRVHEELMLHLSKDVQCYDLIRMHPNSFARLCTILRGTNQLEDNKNAFVEEEVVVFLYMLSHDTRNCAMQISRRSGKTISRRFHIVLQAIISLHDQLIKQPSGAEVPPEILNSSRYYPYFKVNTYPSLHYLPLFLLHIWDN